MINSYCPFYKMTNCLQCKITLMTGGNLGLKTSVMLVKKFLHSVHWDANKIFSSSCIIVLETVTEHYAPAGDKRLYEAYSHWQTHCCQALCTSWDLVWCLGLFLSLCSSLLHCNSQIFNDCTIYIYENQLALRHICVFFKLWYIGRIYLRMPFCGSTCSILGSCL